MGAGVRERSGEGGGGCTLLWNTVYNQQLEVDMRLVLTALVFGMNRTAGLAPTIQLDREGPPTLDCAACTSVEEQDCCGERAHVLL